MKPSRFLVAAGYEPNERFNAMNGSERMIFYDPSSPRHIDLFVGGFRMCHALPLADRLELDSPTLPPAELLLTKLQVGAAQQQGRATTSSPCCSTTT